MIRPVPDIAVTFVHQAEGCRLTAYPDVGGVWTIGVGHCGPEVVAGLTITQSVADTYLREDLEIAANRLARVVDEAMILKLTDHQYAALLSFVFNAGCDPGWTIWKKLNARQIDLVAVEFPRFIHAKGKIIPGLVNRRNAEVALWNTPDDVVHDSGCALHNEPAYPAGPCDCSAKPAVVVPFPAKPAGFLRRLWSLFA